MIPGKNGNGRPVSSRIMIVEDERIVAQDIQSLLEGLGYRTRIAGDGADALKQVASFRPQLILMDIAQPAGSMDGVEIVSKLKEIEDIPILYITAHSDQATISRAQLTQPYGYILKPIKINELQIAIEMTLYRRRMDQEFRDNALWFQTTLKSIGDGVIATGADSRIRMINPAAERLLGLEENKAIGKPVNDLLHFYDEDGTSIENPLTVPERDHISRVLDHVQLGLDSGIKTPVICTISPIHGASDATQGCVITIKNISELHARSEQLHQRAEDLEQDKRLLERYFPENLVDYLVDERRQTELEGRSLEATMLVCDVRNSTGISETLGPTLFAEFLSDLFTGLMDLTYANGGSVNKLMGDGLLITFGCPFHSPDDATNCVRLALQMRGFLSAFNEIRNPALVDPIILGMGIATGIVFAGNIGSPRRVEYTVIGDAVNAASRLESLTKEIGHDILMDSTTQDRVIRTIKSRSVGSFRIRGRKEEMAVYHPGGLL